MPKFSRRSVFCIILSLCAFHLVSASHDLNPIIHRRHTSNANLAKREAASLRRKTSLEKRFDDARFTYYVDGLGACGQTNQPGDFVSCALLTFKRVDSNLHIYQFICPRLDRCLEFSSMFIFKLVRNQRVVILIFIIAIQRWAVLLPDDHYYCWGEDYPSSDNGRGRY